MKCLKLCWILGVFILLVSSHQLRAINDVPMYDEAKNGELSGYLWGLLEVPRVILGNIEASRIRELVMQGADPNITADPISGASSSAIHFAAQDGQCDLIQFLWEHGADIEAKNGQGSTPLHWAVSKGQKKAIALLVRLGANIDPQNFIGSTPLHWATRNIRKEASDALISLGANIDALDNAGNTPLHYLVLNKQWDAVTYALALGANGGENTYRIFLEDAKNVLTPYFSKKDSLPGEHWLYALIRLKKDDLTSIDASADEIKPIINQHDSYKNTPLDIALISRNGSVIPRLLALGADPWHGLFDGVSLAWRITAFKERKDGQPSIYEQVLYVPLTRCWLINQALGEILYNDILGKIIKLEIDCCRNPKKNLIN